MVRTQALTQSRDLTIAQCDDVEELRGVFFDEFRSILQSIRPSHTLLFCLAPARPTQKVREDASANSPRMMRFLVTKHSDFAQVIRCPAFRLQDKRCDEGQAATYAVAFVHGKVDAPSRAEAASARGEEGDVDANKDQHLSLIHI